MSEQAQVLLASFGPVSAGMAAHILLMNLFAPAAAILSSAALVPAARRVPGLAAAMVVQLLLLWGWHAPPSLAAAMERPGLHLVMQLSLTLTAVWFWRAVVAAAVNRPWRAVASLLITSKVFCLLGVLLTFAPRSLYPSMAHHGGVAVDPLADQQLAGLMMLLACPLSYLVAAVVVTSRWLLSSDPSPHRDQGVKVA
jgi:putative membrane protein